MNYQLNYKKDLVCDFWDCYFYNNEDKYVLSNMITNYDEKRRFDMELEKLKEIIADVLNVEVNDITEDTTFVDDLGADSLDIFQIIMGIEETFDIEIDNDDAEQISTVGDAVEQIKNATNNN